MFSVWYASRRGGKHPADRCMASELLRYGKVDPFTMCWRVSPVARRLSMGGGDSRGPTLCRKIPTGINNSLNRFEDQVASLLDDLPKTRFLSNLPERMWRGAEGVGGQDVASSLNVIRIHTFNFVLHK